MGHATRGPPHRQSTTANDMKTETDYSAVEIATMDITRLEKALEPALKLADAAHRSCMRASEELGERNHTGAAHACLGLLEMAVRSLRQANDASRYSRHSLEYPPKP